MRANICVKTRVILVRYIVTIYLISCAKFGHYFKAMEMNALMRLYGCNRFKVTCKSSYSLRNIHAWLLWKWIYWHMFRDRLYADYSKCSPRISIYILRILNESLLHVGWFQICSLTYPAMFVMRHKLPPQCLRKLRISKLCKMNISSRTCS